MSKKKTILRLKGGLGNQLFIYAFGYSFSKKISSELHLDYVTGFIRDHEFNGYYMLDQFNITSDLATEKEMLLPFDRLKRVLMRSHNKILFKKKKYYINDISFNSIKDINKSILLNNKFYLEGYWQSEKYFNEYLDEIFKEFTLKDHLIEKFKKSKYYLKVINQPESVFIHLRDFSQYTGKTNDNIDIGYYKYAIELVKAKLKNPFFYIFCESPSYAKKFLDNENIKMNNDMELIIDDKFQKNDLFDFWLMQNCKNSIIANSTYSWWAAWLGYMKYSGIVTYPSRKSENSNSRFSDCNLSKTKYWFPIISN
jgi:hypothetical protein